MPPGALKHWQCLMEPKQEPLRRAAAEVQDITPAAVTKLRRDWPAELVAIALELAAARRKAATKFADAASLVADVAGVEQATSELVARHKTQRMMAHDPERIVDLCCGIGGDAMTLSARAPTLVVDADPVRAWMAGVNADTESTVADVETFDPGPYPVHIDPDRRPRPGRRAWRYEDYRPGPGFITRLIERQPAVAVKLGPGVDIDVLPPGEVQFISVRGRLVQAVLWAGEFTTHPSVRSALRLPEVARHRAFVDELAATPTVDRVDFDDVLLVPDPALERAGLVGSLAARHDLVAPHPGPGLLTAPAPPDSPWFTPFTVIAQMPWRPENVRRWLAEHHAGEVEVKTRGGAVETDAAARHLRGRGDERFTVFVLRMGTAIRAIITKRSLLE